MRRGFERHVIAYSIVTAITIITVHAIGLMLVRSLGWADKLTAYPLVLGTLATMAASLIVRHWFNARVARWIASGLIAFIVAATMVLFDYSNWGNMLALILVGPFAAMTADWLASRLPSWLDGTAPRYPIRSLLWGLLAIVMIVQTARLSSWVADPTEEFWITTTHPLFAGHLCMNAYVYAADLNRQGVKNVYDQSYYPGLNPDAEVRTTIKNFHPEDPYQYPPQFLILPRLAIALTSDFDLIKIFWLLLQGLIFWFVLWTAARYLEGESGKIAILLIPLIWISFPVLSNLQYGQFHMMSLMMAIAAMIWFARGQHALGGASLAFALWSKLAPGILLAYLIGQKRWKEVGWTLGFCVVYTIVALVVIGVDPFVSFVTYQLPNLQDGSAFAFAEVWPDFRDLIIAGNQSPFALISKLDALGVPGMTVGLAQITHLFYTLTVTVIAFLAGRFQVRKGMDIVIWLALLNLAGMVSKGAWGDYIPIGTIWLLTFVVKDMIETPAQKVAMVVMWVFMFLSLGVLPLPGLDNPQLFISLATIGLLLTIGFNLWIVFRRRKTSPATE